MPMYGVLGVLGVLAWKLSPDGVNLFTHNVMYILWAGLVLLFIFQTSQIHKVNKENLEHGVPELET